MGWPQESPFIDLCNLIDLLLYGHIDLSMHHTQGRH